MRSRRGFLSSVAAGSGLAAAAPAEGARRRSLGLRLRVGVIGPGYRGKALIREVQAVDDTSVEAVADVFSLRHQEARAIEPRAQGYLDYHEMLEREDLDAVMIASPPHLHAEHFIAAMEAGAHVYIEKTMAFSPADAKRMRAARERFPRQVVQVGMQSTSWGAARDVPLMLADDKVGAITEVRANHYRNRAPHDPPWVRDVPPEAVPGNVVWQDFLATAPAVEFDPFRLINWRLFWDYSGGNVFENFVHQLGFWFKALDLPIPDQITAGGGTYLWQDRREIPDVWNVAMQFEGRNMMLSWTSSFGNRFFGVREHALGYKGTIEKIQHSTRYIPEPVTNPNGQEIVGQSLNENHVQNFFDAVRFGREPNCPFEIGFKTAIACRMAVESFRQGRAMRWDTETEEIV